MSAAKQLAIFAEKTTPVTVTIHGVEELLEPLQANVDDIFAYTKYLVGARLPVTADDIAALQSGGVDFYLLRGAIVVTFNNNALMPFGEEGARKFLELHHNAGGEKVDIAPGQAKKVIEELRAGGVRLKVAMLDEMFAEARAIATQYSTSVSSLLEREEGLLAGESWEQAFSKMTISLDQDFQRRLYEVSKKICSRVIGLGRDHYDPNGSLRLAIDYQEVEEAAGVDHKDWNLDNFSAMKAWQYVEENYGGDRAVSKALNDAANAIIKELSLRKGGEVIMRAGRLLLNQSIWIDSFDKKHCGKTKLTTGSSNDVHMLAANLGVFASWADNTLLNVDLRRFGYGYCRDSKVVSRHKHELGEDGELEVITFSTRFEYRFNQALAQQLQVFLSTYGNMPA